MTIGAKEPNKKFKNIKTMTDSIELKSSVQIFKNSRKGN